MVVCSLSSRSELILVAAMCIDMQVRLEALLNRCSNVAGPDMVIAEIPDLAQIFVAAGRHEERATSYLYRMLYRSPTAMQVCTVAVMRRRPPRARGAGLKPEATSLQTTAQTLCLHLRARPGNSKSESDRSALLHADSALYILRQ